nr:adenylate/guanylate cyclase domain-containing protein [Treponema sp.]
TLADSFNDMADSLAEKEFMRDTFGKVVDPEVRDYLMKGGNFSLNRLGGETREVSVLFCDIRSFTAMSEKMSAEEVVSLLNKYFTALGKCISANHGIINKYIGDAIMAIFGAPLESKNSALDAYHAALDMRKALVQVNQELAKEGKAELRFGIGIHTGPVFAGTIGAENRMEYTVIGDTVNTASRLESLCKTYKVDLLISEAAAKKTALPDGELNFVANTEIRGKAENMNVYTSSKDY